MTESVSPRSAANLIETEVCVRYSGPMQQIHGGNFGVLIAFVLPGFICPCGLSVHSSTVESWLLGAGASQTSVGGFLFSTLAALILGLLCSTIRWLVVDSIHHRSGVYRPRRDFRRLQANLDAYRLIESNHYQFYQFYGNSLIAWTVSYGAYRLANPRIDLIGFDFVALGVALLLFLGSRDTLRKYYERVDSVLSQPTLLSPGYSRRHGTACSMESPER